MYKKHLPKLIFVFTIIFVLSFFIVDNFLTMKIDDLTHNRYLSYSTTLKHLVRDAIEDKAFSTKNIALALSENQLYKDFLKKKNDVVANLEHISSKIKKNSNYQNVWIHLVNKDGVSIYRNWSNKKGDNVAKKREELPPLLKNPKIVSIMSVGIFDMTFKTIVPIYDGKNFLGLIEVITKTNSIARKFEKEGINLIILADKRYKDLVKKPYTKEFIDDYYVANVNSKKVLKNLVKKDLSTFISNKTYKLVNDYITTTYYQHDVFGKNMGYFIIFSNLHKVQTYDIKSFENFIKVIGVLIALFITTVIVAIFYYNKSKYTEVLEKEVKQRTKKLQEKQRILHQQAKMASMGEMLENIAHQWRQPLSTITTASTGVKLRKEFDKLDDAFLIESMDLITNSASYLSSTIEDFRDFFRHSNQREDFSIHEVINSAINLINSKLVEDEIEVEIIGEDVIYNGYKNELVQVLLNIINNAKDAFNSLTNKQKILQIQIAKSEKDLLISIHDNAGGIDKKIIDKIFEPYFTTKHKSQGTGIGLYMSQQIIVKHFDGEIIASNAVFNHNKEIYYGATFTIKLKIESDS